MDGRVHPRFSSRGRRQVDPDYERAPVCQREPPRALPRPSLSRPKPLYELKIDTDGDAVADIAYRVRFAPGQGGRQTAIVRRIDGPQAARSGDGGLL
jgi:hypothetical protein